MNSTVKADIPCKKSTKMSLAFRAALCGLLVAASLSWLGIAAPMEQLPENILRLHVVANSDSEADQALKLKVRDAVLDEAGRWCAGAENLEDANFLVCTHLEGIKTAAEETVKDYGLSDSVKALVTEEYFPTRKYEGFTLPAGRYRALRVVIGEGKGHNWWCVMFPSLCLPAAGEPSEDVLAQLPKSQRQVAENPERYKVGFKLVELYEELKDWFRS